MKVLIITLAIIAVWSLLVAVCAPAVGRYLAKLDRDQNGGRS
jgi:hypothetical protein